ncbi:MAG: hypothetical protein IPK31_13255 [Chitinophagaceae bacterium]|nr:hypothetical protein [Chitinophagaceae bacterium]
MQEVIVSKLLEYIRDNNPDLLFELEAEDKLRVWLYEKADSVKTLFEQKETDRQPEYIIIEKCILEATVELRPSRYNYILNLLEQEFEINYTSLLNSGLLQHEVINMIGYCEPVFTDLNFSEENEDNQFIHYAITGMISEYLQSNSENEKVSNGLQQPTKAE